MKRFLFSCLIFVATTLSAEDSCSMEVLKSFYPPEFVEITLKRNGVSDDESKAIAEELKKKEPEVISQVIAKASKMSPNPLEQSDKLAAVKLFSDTVSEVFANVLKEHGITDEAKIKLMLEDVNDQKVELFRKCLKANLPAP